MSESVLHEPNHGLSTSGLPVDRAPEILPSEEEQREESEEEARRKALKFWVLVMGYNIDDLNGADDAGDSMDAGDSSAEGETERDGETSDGGTQSESGPSIDSHLSQSPPVDDSSEAEVDAQSDGLANLSSTVWNGDEIGSGGAPINDSPSGTEHSGSGAAEDPSASVITPQDRESAALGGLGNDDAFPGDEDFGQVDGFRTLEYPGDADDLMVTEDEGQEDLGEGVIMEDADCSE